MKRKRYSDEQTAFALRQAENGTLVRRSAANWVCLRPRSTGGRSSSPAWAW
jgi:hypothetical protein